MILQTYEGWQCGDQLDMAKTYSKVSWFRILDQPHLQIHLKQLILLGSKHGFFNSPRDLG